MPPKRLDSQAEEASRGLQGETRGKKSKDGQICPIAVMLTRGPLLADESEMTWEGGDKAKV